MPSPDCRPCRREQHSVPYLPKSPRNKQTTGLGHVTAADMKRLMVCAPPMPVARAYDEIASPIFQRIMQNQLESRTLAAARDLLLPKLMSGEIRVKEAEKAGEAVA
jgi:type I restriction enzyme S subunit